MSVCIYIYVCKYRKADSSQLMMTGWSDGLHCRSFLAHYKRQHYLRACGVTVKDPGLSHPVSTLLIAVYRSVVASTVPNTGLYAVMLYVVMRWRFSVAVTHWPQSTQLLYIEPG